MDLFLASKIDQTLPKLVQEYNLACHETPTVYIPTGQNCYSPPPALDDRGSYQALMHLGFPTSVVDLEQESEASIGPKLKDAKLLVVAGGNTYFLLYHMKRCGFRSILPSLLSKGMIYAGSSAGSCVCSPDISYIRDSDDVRLAPGLTDTTALHLVDFEVYPHCIEDWFANHYSCDKLHTIFSSPGKKMCLRDNQAIVVSDTWYKIV